MKTQVELSGYVKRNFEVPDKNAPYFTENGNKGDVYFVDLKDSMGVLRVRFPEHTWAAIKDKK